jgi:glycerate kinase
MRVDNTPKAFVHRTAPHKIPNVSGMKIVIAPDSFKESLSAAEVAQAIAAGVRRAAPDAHIVCLPMADGGEGTLDAVLAATGGQRREIEVRGALGEVRRAGWGWLGEGRAVVEMAQAAGLELTPAAQREPMRASSHGVGELIRAALDAGAAHIVLGLGGSATTDGGAGMIAALGARLLDAQGQALPEGGGALARLARIDLSGLDARIARTRFEVACDVDNPLCGPEGAARVFGPQKGATPEQTLELDRCLAYYAQVCAPHLPRGSRSARDVHDVRDGRDVYDARDSHDLPAVHDRPGAGAAGGLGYAALAFLNASLRPGVQIVAELAGLEGALTGAALAFTGEGRLDAQTLRGKTPAGVIRMAHRLGVPVVALAGSLAPGYQALHEIGLTAAFSLTSGPASLQHAMEHAAPLLTERAFEVTRLWLAAFRETLT